MVVVIVPAPARCTPHDGLGGCERLHCAGWRLTWSKRYCGLMCCIVNGYCWMRSLPQLDEVHCQGACLLGRSNRLRITACAPGNGQCQRPSYEHLCIAHEQQDRMAGATLHDNFCSASVLHQLGSKTLICSMRYGLSCVQLGVHQQP